MPTDPLAETIEYCVAAWPASAQVKVDLGALSHPGQVRANNEDCYLLARFTRAMQPLRIDIPLSDGKTLAWIYARGEVLGRRDD